MGLSLHHPTEAKQNECQARTAVRFQVNWKCMDHLHGHLLAVKYVDTWARTDRAVPGKQQALSRGSLLLCYPSYSVNYADIEKELKKVKWKKRLLREQMF